MKLPEEGTLLRIFIGESDRYKGKPLYEEIKRQIASIVFLRPEQHFLNRPEVEHQDFVMTQVGG